MMMVMMICLREFFKILFFCLFWTLHTCPYLLIDCMKKKEELLSTGLLTNIFTLNILL